MVSPVHGDYRRLQAEIPLIVLFRFPEPALRRKSASSRSLHSRTSTGANGKRLFAASDRGSGPATSVPLDTSASEKERPGGYRSSIISEIHATGNELACDHSHGDSEAADDAGSPAEIQMIFRRQIAGLRRLPRRERAQALRAALEWLWFAMAALREKQACARHTRYMRRRLQRPGLG